MRVASNPLSIAINQSSNQSIYQSIYQSINRLLPNRHSSSSVLGKECLSTTFLQARHWVLCFSLHPGKARRRCHCHGRCHCTFPFPVLDLPCPILRLSQNTFYGYLAFLSHALPFPCSICLSLPVLPSRSEVC